MDYLEKYKKFDKKTAVQKFTVTMNIRGGDGGSDNIICIGDDVVYKIIPYHIKNPNSKYRFEGDQDEIKLYKKLTKDFILSDKTPHIVGYYCNYKTDITNLFKGLPSVNEVYMKKSEKIEQQLVTLRFNYQSGVIKKNADVITIEKCPLTISIYIEKNLNKIESILHRIIFQIIYTLAVIQKKYPSFVHNDLFLRNVLAVEEKSYGADDYVEYKFNNRKFYLKANGLYVKINDFGYSLESKYFLDKRGKNVANFRLGKMPNVNCKKCDIFNFLHDLYDGANMGGKSVKSILKKNKKCKKGKIIDKVFKTYLDIKTINAINKNNRRLLNKTWSLYHLPFLQKCVEEPSQYLSKITFKKPKKCNIIKYYKGT